LRSQCIATLFKLRLPKFCTYILTEKLTYLLAYLLLAGHTQPFSEKIRAAVPVLTDMTLELYQTIVKELPPTPSKFHYLFNLRDLSRIYNGLCLTTPEKFFKVLLLVVW